MITPDLYGYPLFRRHHYTSSFCDLASYWVSQVSQVPLSRLPVPPVMKLAPSLYASSSWKPFWSGWKLSLRQSHSEILSSSFSLCLGSLMLQQWLLLPTCLFCILITFYLALLGTSLTARSLFSYLESGICPGSFWKKLVVSFLTFHQMMPHQNFQVQDLHQSSLFTVSCSFCHQNAYLYLLASAQTPE